MPETPEIKPTDLRGILRYVPLWRGHTFVISLDGSIVEHENLANLILDLAVLGNLGIRVVIVHGIGRQLRRLAEKEGVAISDQHGGGPTDETTLNLAVKAAAVVSHDLMQGLTQTGQKCVVPNAIRSTEIGILSGTDQLYTGRVDKIDLPMIKNLLDDDVLPIVSPIAFDRGGKPLRINSDHLAAELATALDASKLIYLTAHPGLTVRGEFRMNVPVEEVEALLEEDPEAIDPQVRSKAIHAVNSIRKGDTARAHILDGRLQDGLLTELFSKVGIGTMIHGNEYQQIRPASPYDAQTIYNITQNAVKKEALVARSREAIEQAIDDYFVYEIDSSVIAVARLLDYPEDGACEIANVYVQPFYQSRGAGRKLVEYALRETGKRGRGRLFALTTQSAGFFKDRLGFEEVSNTELPDARARELEMSGRKSRVFVKKP